MFRQSPLAPSPPNRTQLTRTRHVYRRYRRRGVFLAPRSSHRPHGTTALHHPNTIPIAILLLLFLQNLPAAPVLLLQLSIVLQRCGGAGRTRQLKSPVMMTIVGRVTLRCGPPADGGGGSPRGVVVASRRGTVVVVGRCAAPAR